MKCGIQIGQSLVEKIQSESITQSRLLYPLSTFSQLVVDTEHKVTIQPLVDDHPSHINITPITLDLAETGITKRVLGTHKICRMWITWPRK